MCVEWELPSEMLNAHIKTYFELKCDDRYHDVIWYRLLGMAEVWARNRPTTTNCVRVFCTTFSGFWLFSVPTRSSLFHITLNLDLSSGLQLSEIIRPIFHGSSTSVHILLPASCYAIIAQGCGLGLERIGKRFSLGSEGARWLVGWLVGWLFNTERSICANCGGGKPS